MSSIFWRSMGIASRGIVILMIAIPIVAYAQPMDSQEDEFVAAVTDDGKETECKFDDTVVNEPAACIVELFLEGDKNALRTIAAEYASKNIDFLDISYLDPDNTSDKGGFSVTYKWNAESSDQEVDLENGRYLMRRKSYGLDIDGKYAFNDTLNNNDLSTISAKFSLERGDFGKLRPIVNAEAFMSCLVDLQKLVPQPTDSNDVDGWALYDENYSPRGKACWTDYGIDEIAKSYDATYVYAMDFHANLEGNQDYSDKNLVFGLSAALAMQTSSKNKKRNIFDFPFRLMRESFSNDSSYVAPWPSVKIDIDSVDASNNEMREALTSELKFTRATGEVAFQTILANFKGDPVRFNVSYRYFYEFSAPNEIKAANMDSFDYVAMSLRFPARLIPIIDTDDYEFYFTYTTGQLPFDLQSEKAFEVGISTNISQLARLFGE